MTYKVTFLYAAAHLRDLYIYGYRIGYREKKMTCHKNPGPDNKMHTGDSRYKMGVAGEYPRLKLNRHLPTSEIPVIYARNVYAVAETRT
jgi:hypothetical protein